MPMDIYQDKVDQAVLALLSLGRHEGFRTWKCFDQNSRTIQCLALLMSASIFMVLTLTVITRPSRSITSSL